jgi:hypothetical protein
MNLGKGIQGDGKLRGARVYLHSKHKCLNACMRPYSVVQICVCVCVCVGVCKCVCVASAPGWWRDLQER